MNSDLFNDFLNSTNTLQIYAEDKLVFSSDKDRLRPLLEYLGEVADPPPQVVIFDRVVGNAAALLAVRANSIEIYSPMGSELAVESLDKYGIKHHFNEIVPYIQQPNKEMCPMEKLSLGKTPEEFHETMKNLIKGGSQANGKD
ncbi:DUF1893 domain-containing protein [Chloroflexota bacterium]